MSRLLLSLCVLLLVCPTPEAMASPNAPVVTSLGRAAGETLPEKFEAERRAAEQAGRHVVVVFTADWCTPCRALKDWLDRDPVVRKATASGHFVLIDVDTWRGPAHRLIPGAMPRKLPMLARVDRDGALVTKAMGSEIGLLSAEDTAQNLRRLIEGGAPETPSYKDDKDRQRELSRAESRRRSERMSEWSAVSVTVTRTIPSWPHSLHLLDLVIHNPEARRRWYTIPLVTTAKSLEETTVTTHQVHRFTEHPRATFHHFEGASGFTALPVSGHSTVRLEGWPVWGPATLESLEVWALNTLRLGENTVQLPPKLPWELHIQRAYALFPLERDETEVPARLKVHTRHVVSPSR